MHSTLTVVTPNTHKALTSLPRVKSELGITVNTFDALLTSKISEASSDIESHLNRVLRREELEQVFWGSCSDLLILDRSPVAEIISVTVDGSLVDAYDYRCNTGSGLLHRLGSGSPIEWSFGQSVSVVFEAGYLMPGEADYDLPPALEAACVELVSSYWASRGRDPSVREEDIPGLMRKVYWVGAVGNAGELPPSVEAKLGPFRAMVL